MDDHPMQKLHRINKEKDFWGGHRKNIRKINCWQSQITPLSRLCAAFAAGARKQPLAPIPAPVGPFLRNV